MPPATAQIAALRAALANTSSPAIAMAAHNPLTAKLAFEAGYSAIWVSGFELSASYAVPDASILPVSTHLEATRAMGEVQPLPLIADLDTGYGNAVNLTYVVRKYEEAGAAAVVIEDNVFPKESSLRAEPAGAKRKLAGIAEFQGKIAAAKAASSVLVIARTEALIAGYGEEEALKRAGAWAEAGADAVLIHSKARTPDEVVGFCKRWDGRVPVVIIPTNYPQLGFKAAGELGKVGLVICGNHTVRAVVEAVRRTYKRILEEGGIEGIEGEIASVQEVFKLQGDGEMREIEKKFLR
ncbi:phosphoenolpyruvate phosphomutase [Mytilinidion resinicola]|uniref:Phosphoenolpyruvate phosphomutase n=1 Tax=Mytilinidion resinicola TaxID=574789 RepID=A0A6A6YSU3_9PEZI|nr:phosphoenolpyruvate phosphomutase [Mytilinidion resinicola]KAF2811589.1 phosphoenolpyruvate phosphomutase [Mytilinidion resinicola]